MRPTPQPRAPAGADAAASSPAHSAWHAMRALVLDHERRKDVCDALDMSFVRVKALIALMLEPLTMRDLAAHLSTDAPYTTLIVDDLEQRRLVTRAVHPNDRRAKIVALTTSGRQAAHTAERILGEPPTVLKELPLAQLRTLDEIMSLLTRDKG